MHLKPYQTQIHAKTTHYVAGYYGPRTHYGLYATKIASTQNYYEHTWHYNIFHVITLIDKLQSNNRSEIWGNMHQNIHTFDESHHGYANLK